MDICSVRVGIAPRRLHGRNTLHYNGTTLIGGFDRMPVACVHARRIRTTRANPLPPNRAAKQRKRLWTTSWSARPRARSLNRIGRPRRVRGNHSASAHVRAISYICARRTCGNHRGDGRRSVSRDGVVPIRSNADFARAIIPFPCD